MKRSQSLRIVAVAFALQATSICALAQTPTSTAIALPQNATPLTPPAGSKEFGILWLKPGFRITEFGVDTNVFALSNNQQKAPADFVVAVQPSIDVGIATQRFNLAVTPVTELVRYSKSKTQSSTNPAVTAKVERRLSSRVALIGQGVVGISRDRLGLEIDARARRFSQGVTAGVRLSNERTYVTVTASESTSHFDRGAEFLGVQLASQLDRTSHSADVETGYRLSSFTSVAAAAQIQSDRFAARVRSTDSARVTGGFDFNPRALLSGSIRVGYKATRPLSLTVPPFKGPVASGGLTLKVRDSFSLSGGVDRDLDYSYRLDRPYFIYDLYEGSVRQALLRRLDIAAGIQWTKLDYRLFGSPGSPAAAAHVYDYLVNTSATVGVTLARGSRVGVYVARWQRYSGDTPYRSDRIGLIASIGRANINERGVFVNGPGR